MVLLLMTQLAGPVVAHHGGRPIGSFSRCNRPVTPPRCTSVGNNFTHHVYFDVTLTDGLASSLADTMAEDYEPTKLTMVVDEEVTPSTDVIAYSEDYGENGAAGWVACPPDSPQGTNPSGHRWCQGQELFLNLNPRYAVFFDDDASRDHVTCHELGHTLGLRHWGNPPESNGPAAATCMNSNTPNGPTHLHQIDIDHINAYGYRTQPAPAPKWRQYVLMPLGLSRNIDPIEVEHSGSLDEIANGADAVVVGRISEVRPGRVFGGRSGRPLHYGAASLDVTAVLGGTVRGAAIVTLEVPLFDGPESITALEQTEGSEGVFFLSAKTDGPFYRLTQFGAVVANEGGLAGTTEGPPAIQALGGKPFGEIVARLRSAAR